MSFDVASTVERRLLVNYRVDPEVAARLLPAPFRPRLANGYAVAGICLIRLRSVRPRGLPAAVGLRAENAAHRIAVEWDDAGATRRGVYIPARHTASRLVATLGGRVFPGLHSRSRFTVTESGDRLAVGFEDDAARVDVRARLAPWPGSALWGSFDAASRFFETGGPGLSVTREANRLDAVHLHCDRWRVEPVALERVTSSFYDDERRFPPGSVVLDTALLMRDVPVVWQPLPAVESGPNCRLQQLGSSR
ncbi:DUF2071 domain-containing protein [Spongisporangium articulatum]|uniref:DUF2071 domain-containing protein n=1 Tax=Spongisporangium articulatum TaxID=3362603 RepID=A0ABW8AIN9_9ACTN